MRLTNIETIILENTDPKYKYIARDKNGELYIYEMRPRKSHDYNNWGGVNGEYLDISCYSHIFKEIKWYDDEPFKFR